MGQGGCTSLCSAVNSCTPLQGLITQVSLEIPATETPGGRGAGKKKIKCNVCHVCSAFLRKSSSSRTFLLERIYFTALSNMSLGIFSRAGWLLRFNWSGSLYTGKDYVTDKRLSSKIRRWQLSWISICVHIASISYFILTPPPIFHLNSRFAPTGWFQMCHVCTKPKKYTMFSHYFTLYPKHIKIWICRYIRIWCHLGQMSVQ